MFQVLDQWNEDLQIFLGQAVQPALGLLHTHIKEEKQKKATVAMEGLFKKRAGKE